jgi:3-oxoacyl-[acyl-carrier protein] reductase
VGLLETKTALITGGTHGIGREIAITFAREGANVIVNYLTEYDQERSFDDASLLVSNLIQLSGAASAFPADVSDEVAVINMFKTIEKHVEGVDILVNNAGFITLSRVNEMTTAQWDKMIAVHLRGTFLTTKSALPYMLKKKSGRIINISSQIGQVGRIEYAHYAAAKAGIIGFTKSLAREVAKDGVLVNCIAPGPISTGIIPKVDGRAEPNFQVSLPLGRAGEPSEVAPTALFLATSASSLYVGQTLSPNSGDVML